MANAQQPRRNHRERAAHVRTVLFDGLEHHVRLFGRSHASQSDQDDARMYLPLPEHKLAEVLGSREQKALLIVSGREHFFVRRSDAGFSKIFDAEAAGAKRIDNCFVYTFVRDKVHAADSG